MVVTFELRAKAINFVTITNTTIVYNTTEVIVEEEELVYLRDQRKTQYGLTALSGFIVVAVLAYGVVELTCRYKTRRDERAKIEGEQLGEISVAGRDHDGS